MVAAVPAYIGHNYQDTPPGHRFGLYFDAWDEQWRLPDTEKRQALKRAAPLGVNGARLLRALRERQRALAASQALETMFSVDATAIAPFTTGLGNEHPLENGFAFLSPYGLPYLPGSGVKGVLRRAAEALSAESETGWTPEALAKLFGYEADSGATDAPRNRGALEFWDVFPQLADDRLLVDILNPHHSGYYQNGAAPHDAENPKPVFFLTVPPGSPFTFDVRCHAALLPEALRKDWRTLLESAFELAFDWIGFGAKTAVGYGQFPSAAITQAQADRQEQARRQREAEAAAQAEAERQKQREAMSPLDRAIEEVLTTAPKDQPRHKALLNALKQGRWSSDEVGQVAERIHQMMVDSGVWRPQSAKKKPEKDEPYQTTLAILAYLGGKKS